MYRTESNKSRNKTEKRARRDVHKSNDGKKKHGKEEPA